MMEENIIAYMVNRQWEASKKTERKRYMYRLAQQSRAEQDFSSKIGGMLIYNQVIEQFLQDIIVMSIHFIKAEIWPVSVSLDVDIDKATFGKMIEYFKQFATLESNQELILSHLKKFNTKRNQVVHDLFDIKDLNRLAEELEDYADLADEILHLLVEYENEVCENLCALANRVNFKKYL